PYGKTLYEHPLKNTMYEIRTAKRDGPHTRQLTLASKLRCGGPAGACAGYAKQVVLLSATSSVQEYPFNATVFSQSDCFCLCRNCCSAIWRRSNFDRQKMLLREPEPRKPEHPPSPMAQEKILNNPSVPPQE
ncbi:unnamed protein product, partial [Pleuronectes platessa]